MQEPLVPWNFWKSEIGKTILQVQFGIHINDKLYSISDIAKLINVSVSQVRKDISARKLNNAVKKLFKNPFIYDLSRIN